MTILSRFKNSQYFDRKAESVTLNIFDNIKDKTGKYGRVEISSTVQNHTFISPVERKRIKPQFLDKYSKLNYIYLESKLDLTIKDKEYIVSIDGEEFKVIDYHGFFLTSGFYKYLIGGTGKDV